MKLMKVITALAALTFGIGAYASIQATTRASEDFDSLTAGDSLDTGVFGGNWATWEGTEDETLTVTAWGDTTTSASRPDAISSTQTNYLKLDTSLTNGVTFAAAGVSQTTSEEEGAKTSYEPNPCSLDDVDQLYFDSLVNLTAGDPDTLSAVKMPDDGRLALWLQTVEVEKDGATEEVNQLCIRAGKMTDFGSAAQNIYTAKLDNVSTGWHRLTVRLFKNAARSGGTLPALAIYLDEVAVPATEATMSDNLLASLTPKAKLLADTNSLFPSAMQTVSSTLGDVKGVQFAGTGDIDDIVFTTSRPNFITADQDINYFHLTWDEHVTSISYTVNNGDSTTIDKKDDLAAKETDIALVDGKETTIAVTVEYAAGFGAGNWTSDGAGLNGDTFTIEAGKVSAIGGIVSASSEPTAKAVVTIDGVAVTPDLEATTLADLITKINEKIGEVAKEGSEGSVYITLSGNQTVTMVQGAEGWAEGAVELGTDGNDAIVWTLDLNGFSITGAGDAGTAAHVSTCGTVVITDKSAAGTGAIKSGTLAGCMFENYATLTIEGGTFDGSMDLSDYEADGMVTFNGGKFLIGDDTDGTYLEFINNHKGEGVTFAADSDNTYYVASGSTPVVETFTVTFVNEKATETTTTATVNKDATVAAPDPAPTADGFKFLGWFETDDQGVLADTAFDFTSTPITANITLTAKWAQVVAKIGDTGYATIQEALDAAVAAESATQVDIVANYSASFTEPMKLTGKGRDVTDITINVADGVVISNSNRESGFMMIDNAKVTFTGTGTWKKPNTDTAYPTATFFKVGENGADSAADIVVNSGTFMADNAKIFSIQNGTINVNGGEFREDYGSVDTYCIRIEASANGNAAVTINGGTFIGGTAVSENHNVPVPPVGINGTAEGATLSVVIPTTSTAKFKGVADQITNVMADYITKDASDTNDYKFKLGEDDYYTVAAINYATLTVTFDSTMVSSVSVTNAAGKAYETGAKFDVDDAVVLYADVKLVDGYELDEASSTLEVTMTADAEIKVVAKAVAPVVTPVDPGSETECADQAAADAKAAEINGSKTTMINVPSIEGINATTFCNLFTATVVTGADGKFYVKVDLDPTADGVKAIQTVIDAIAKPDADGKVTLDLAALATANQEATITSELGLYYTVYAGADTPKTLDAVQCQQATGATLKLTFPTKGTRGFYKVGVSAKPVEVPTVE